MPFARSASLRDLTILCGVLSAISVPVACAHGSTETDIGLGGNSGAGGQTVGHLTTVNNTTTTTSGFPSASSTTSTTSGFTTVGPTSTSGGGSVCDNSGDCQTCVGCADSSVCATLSNTCFNDFDCFIIDDCTSSCTDQACFQSCLAGAPTSAQQEFIDYYNCLVCSCVNDCMVAAGSCP